MPAELDCRTGCKCEQARGARAEPTVQHSGRPSSSTEGKANIRANKPVPECRTESHAVSDIPLDDCIRRPRCYGVGRSDTSSDSVALPGSQEVRRFEYLRLHPPESCQKLNVLAVGWRCFVSVRSPMLRAWLEPVCGAGPVGRSWSPRQRSIAWGVSMSGARRRGPRPAPLLGHGLL